MPGPSFIQVILPLRLEWEPYYRCDAPVAPGDRVEVPLSGKTYIGVVSATGVTPDVSGVKPVLSTETGLEKVLPEELALWRRMASYYLCTLGEIYRAAYPASVTEEEEKALLQRARQEERLAAKEAELGKTRPGTKKEAALREGIARLRTQLGLDGVSDPEPVRITGNGDSPAVRSVREAFAAGRTVLLEAPDDAQRIGIYRELARETLSRGKNVLWLVPTPAHVRQIEPAVREAFPDALFHDSTCSAAARRKNAAALRGAAGSTLVAGTRQALLLPHRNLGLVIIDNEQHKAYKQESTAPRYNGRDTALMLSRLQGACAILGSPTPSLDALHNARTGRFCRIHLPSSAPQGGLLLIGTAEERRKRGMDGELSFKLLSAVRDTLEQGRSVVVLLSRKSYDPEGRVAARLRELFPSGVTVGDPGMVNGADLRDVGLIALLFADALLADDDYRADERALQLLRQLRARGPLAVQAKDTTHPVFAALASDDTAALMQERESFGYPPFSRMVRIAVRDPLPKRLDYLSGRLAAALSAALGGNRVAGPYTPSRNEGGTLRHIRILLPRDRELESRKQCLLETLRNFEKELKYPGHIYIDVDPA